jgi:hypothetical protein
MLSSNISVLLAIGGHTCKTEIWREKNEDLEFEASLTYIVSSRPAWTTLSIIKK